MTLHAVVGSSVQLMLPGSRLVDVDFNHINPGDVPSIGMFGNGVFASFITLDDDRLSKSIASNGPCAVVEYLDGKNRRDKRSAVICGDTVIETAGGCRFVVSRSGDGWHARKLSGDGECSVVGECKEPGDEGAPPDGIPSELPRLFTPQFVVQPESPLGTLNATMPAVESDFKVDYGTIDYGMPRRCAFAVGAKGKLHEALKKNLVSKLQWYVPGVDIVDVDMPEARMYIGDVGGYDELCFSKLAIPLMKQFERYDRVIWVDDDVDVQSSMFAGVLAVDSGASGVAASPDMYQKFYRHYMEEGVPGYSKTVYFNTGVTVLDLYKIDRGEWKRRLEDGVRMHAKKHFRWRDQDVLNGFFDVREMSYKYNCLWCREGVEQDDPYAIHYCNSHGARVLMDILSSGPDGNAVDAVFVIGTGSQNGNEELKYALRNLDAHCKFIRNVYICGECPDWVDTFVVHHLPWPDRFRHAKDANIIDKLRHACEQPGIAKKILFCSDDQFQTRPCTWDDFYPRYLRKYDRSDDWYATRNRVWHTRLRDTLDRDFVRREAKGLDTGNIYYWQPHIWMPIDRDKFIEYAQWSDYEHRVDTIIASGYFNFVNPKPMPNNDHVFIGGGDVPDVLHIAYTDGDSYNAAMRFLTKKFPTKCRFEVGYGIRTESAESSKNMLTNSFKSLLDKSVVS